MITPYSNIISVTTLEAPTFEFTVKTDNAGVSTSTQFRMPLTTSTGLNFDVDWGDGSSIENITVHTNAIHTYATAGTYNVKVTGSILGWQFANGGDRLKMLNIASWGVLNISVASGFQGCTNLTCSATDAPTITSTSLASYFRSCTNFNGAIGNWDVSGVTNMSIMFSNAAAFNANIANWDVANVQFMNSMFSGAAAFNQNIGNWDTSSAINMQSMFSSAAAFNQNISSWNTSLVTNTQAMFSGASAFNQDISTKVINAGQPNEYIAWNFSNVTNITEMFRNATAFNQDIGNWDVSNVNDGFGFMSNKTSANYSAENLASIYNQWSLLTLQPNVNISFNTIDYCDTSETNKQSIVTNYAWTITDGNAIPC